MITRYVDTASAGGDGSTENLSGSNAAYSSLRAALDVLTTAGSTTDLTKIICKASGGAADTLSCTQAQWNFTTTATNYLWIYVDPAHRHSGKWTTGRYRMEVTNEDAIYNNLASHVRMEGMQNQVTHNDTGNEYRCFRLCTANNATANIDHRYINCVANIVVSGGTSTCFGFHDSDPVTFTGTSRRINCIAASNGGRVGFTSDGSTWADTNLINYNCTAYGNRSNYENSGLNFNCIGAAFAEFSDFNGVTAGGSNNASSDDSAPGTSSHINQTFAFVDTAGRNFHLLSTDTGARGRGVTDPGSGLYSTDIDEEERTVPWDIGADEFIQLPSMGYFRDPISVTSHRPAAFRPGLAR